MLKMNTCFSSILKGVSLLIATWSLGACSSQHDELLEGHAIGFTTQVGTKAQLLNAFPEGGSFGVLGYCKVNGESGEADWATKRVQATPNEFYNAQVTYTQAQGCVYSPRRAWSDNPNDKYTFFAYYPYNAVNENGVGSPISLSSKSAMGAPTLTYQMPYNSSDRNQELDLTKMQDVMIGFAFDKTQAMGAVPFMFYHVLTSLNFSVNNYNRDKEIVITSLTLNGSFNQSLTFSMDGVTNQTAGTYQGMFKLLTEEQRFAPNATSGAAKICLANELLLIPQMLTNGEWMVDVCARNSEQAVGEEKSFQFVLDQKTFSMGTQYTFNFDFLGDVCTLRVQQQDQWDTPAGEDNEVTFE